MAGSYRHVTTSNAEYSGMELIENLGDAAECIEEMWHMIDHLTGGDKAKIHAAWRDGYARKFCPPENEPLFTFEEFWQEDDDEPK